MCIQCSFAQLTPSSTPLPKYKFLLFSLVVAVCVVSKSHTKIYMFCVCFLADFEPADIHKRTHGENNKNKNNANNIKISN